MNVLKICLQIAAISVLLGLATVNGAQPSAGGITSAELFPASTIAYAEAKDLPSAIELIRNHPFKERVFALPAYDVAMKAGSLSQLTTGVAGFEAMMGMPWHEAIATLSDGGISIGLDSSGAVTLLIKSSDEETLTKFRQLLLAFLPKEEGSSSAQEVDYRGVNAYELRGVVLAQMDTFLMLTNRPEMGRTIVDQYIDRTPQSLATLPNFQKSQQPLASKEPSGGLKLVSAYLDLNAVRASGIAKDLFEERIDNVVGEIVLGGVLTNLRHSPFVTVSVNLGETGIALRLASPHEQAWESPREYHFGEGEVATAPPLIELQNRLFAVSAHRDMSQMWLRNGDFLSAKAVDGMAKADAQFGVFFSGRDFGEDILGSFDSGIQMVGRVQDFGDRRPQPAIKLPEFALVFQMKDAEKTQPEMRRTFQSFIGFLNVTGSMEGRPQLDLGMETVKSDAGDGQLYTATFVASQDERDSMAAPMQFNFSPTLAFAGDRIVFSSSIPLAKDLVTSDANQDENAPPSNTAVAFNGETLKNILEENREQLVASNMLSKGHSKQEAEGEIGFLLELVGFLDSGQISLDFEENEMSISAKVQVK